MLFFFSSRRRHTRCSRDWSSDVCSSDLLVRRVESLPGVESTAAVNHLPLGGSNSSNPFLIEGQPEPPPGQEHDGRYRVCTPNYFRTMGIVILKGRAFTDQDSAAAPPVVIINETLARKYWPNTDPIGQRMRYPGPLDKYPWMQVVGVVQDVKHEMNLPVTSEFYIPHAQDAWQSMVLVAKTKVDPAAMAAPIRAQVWSIDKAQPAIGVHTMREVQAISLALYSFSSIMLSIFAGVALLLAAIGIYGVMSYAVTQRTQEIGIRMALGARAMDVLKMVVGNGMTLAILGVFAGLVGEFAVTRLLTSLLFGVSPTADLTYSVVTHGLLLVALLAC